MTNTIKWLVSLSLAVAPVTALAHHSFQAEYDESKPLRLVGTLTKVLLENPHGWLYLDVRNEAGRTVNWALEIPAPNRLAQNGYNMSIYQTLLTSEEMVTVMAFAARDGSKHAWAGGLTRADGQTVITLSGIPEQGPGARGGRGR